MEASTYLIKLAIDKAVKARLLMGALHGSFNGAVPGMIGGALAAFPGRNKSDLAADQILDTSDSLVSNSVRGAMTGALGGAAGGALGAAFGGAVRPSQYTHLPAKEYAPQGSNALSTHVRYPMPGYEVPGMQIGSRIGGALSGYGAQRGLDRIKELFRTKSVRDEQQKEIDTELKDLPSAGVSAAKGAVTGAGLGALYSWGPFRRLQPHSVAHLATKRFGPGKGALVGGAIGAGTGALRNVLIRHLDKDRLQKAQSKGKKKEESKTDKDKGAR